MQGMVAPPWLEPMLMTQYFARCSEHREVRRNECNMFCADCSEQCSAFCIFCRAEKHSDHRVIQIRRSSYHEVVKVVEVEGLVDVTGVHTYVINSCKVFFLNERPQPKGVGAAAGRTASSPYFCEVCCRSLLNNFRFCSLGCKLARIKSNGDGTFVLREREREGSRECSRMSTGSREGGEGSSVAKDAAVTPHLRSRRRKGIPHRSLSS